MRRASKALTCAFVVALAMSGSSASALADAPSAAAQATASASASPLINDKPSGALSAPNRKVYMRIDDGRYDGFHRDDPEQLRSSERVFAETDRIRQERRAQRSEANANP